MKRMIRLLIISLKKINRKLKNNENYDRNYCGYDLTPDEHENMFNQEISVSSRKI